MVKEFNNEMFAVLGRKKQHLLIHHLVEKHMNFIVWIIVGGVLGWIASLIMKTDAQQGILLNIVVGIVGAFLAGLLISPLVGIPTINDGSLHLGSLVISLAGAVVLLAIVNLVRRAGTR
jgi:uncharacterized membrane protein YeaQ/YmgE (transglycosylase-associated protein family)